MKLTPTTKAFLVALYVGILLFSMAIAVKAFVIILAIGAVVGTFLFAKFLFQVGKEIDEANERFKSRD